MLAILLSNAACTNTSRILAYIVTIHWQERQRKLAEEQRNLMQQQAQAKAQMLRYEDELARKRMQVKGACFSTCLFYSMLNLLKGV